MLTKISGLARALYIVLAIVAAFVALSPMNVPLVLVVLGLIAGLTLPRDRMLLALAAVIALPIVGAALATLPAIGAELSAAAANLALGIAGAVATATAIMLYELVMEGVMGAMGNGKPAPAKKAATA